MNTISKTINSIFLTAVIASAPAYASEMQTTQQQDTAQTSVVWYKKRSTHMVAAFAATAIGLYALAVRKNKIAGPAALFTAIFYGRKNAQEIDTTNDSKDADKEQNQAVTSEDQDTTPVDPIQEETEKDQLPTPAVVEQNVLSTQEAPLHIKAQQRATDVLNSVKSWIAAGLTDEDSSQN